MANNASTIRRNIRALDSPLELRELNRQLEWLWKKLLGNLDDKAFSDGAIRNIVTTIENQIVESVSADSVDTNLLSAAIAKMMVAVIGICDADYLNAVDIDADQLLVRDGYGEDFSFRNLKILYAQVANATIGDLCIRAEDGSYYQLNVDTAGIVTAVPVAITEEEAMKGISNNGNVILETEIVADELNASNLLATYALINKIRAEEIDTKTLFAREATLLQLNAIDISGNESIRVAVSGANEMLKWFDFDNELGLVIKKPAYTDSEGTLHPASIWYTVTDETGYHIYNTQQTAPVGSFRRGGLNTTGVQIGDIVAKRTPSGGWVWTDAT